MNNTRITVVGRVGTSPDSRRTSWGDLEVSFRLAAQERFRNAEGVWEDGHTSWYTVRLRKQLADNVRGTIEKGMQLIVCGKLRVRKWENDERSGIVVEIDGDHVGPDLAVARATVQRIVRLPENEAAQQPGATPAEAGTPQPETHGGTPSANPDGWAVLPQPVGAAAGGASVGEVDPPF